MRPMLTCLALVACIVTCLAEEPRQKTQVIVGKVIAIADGDTLTVRSGEENHKIRLVGIDCPEKGQDYGTKAKQALAAMVDGKRVRIEWTERDKYGRILGDVYRGKRWVNGDLVRDGWAWHYVQYSDDERLATAEQEARKAKRGLWADPNEPVPPWEYRKPKPKEVAAGYWLNSSSNVRHNSSCKHFRNTKRGRACSATEGKPCGICGG